MTGDGISQSPEMRTAPRSDSINSEIKQGYFKAKQDEDKSETVPKSTLTKKKTLIWTRTGVEGCWQVQKLKQGRFLIGSFKSGVPGKNQ